MERKGKGMQWGPTSKGREGRGGKVDEGKGYVLIKEGNGRERRGAGLILRETEGRNKGGEDQRKGRGREFTLQSQDKYKKH